MILRARAAERPSCVPTLSVGTSLSPYRLSYPLSPLEVEQHRAAAGRIECEPTFGLLGEHLRRLGYYIVLCDLPFSLRKISHHPLPRSVGTEHVLSLGP